jgi:hypothetical protein
MSAAVGENGRGADDGTPLRALDMASGRLNAPRVFIGRVIGPFLKPIYSSEKPFSKKSPTDKKLIFSAQRDFLREQEQLKLRVRQFHAGGEGQCARHQHSLERSLLENGAAECTNISITTCGSS